MRITEIKVLPVAGNDKLKAYVTVKLDDCFIVRDLKIIEGASGAFVAMPAKKMKDGSYRDLMHPIDKATREMFDGEIMKEYNNVMRQRSQTGAADARRADAAWPASSSLAASLTQSGGL
ncbi:MAG: septation protein SpoVG family protein [Deltaproteobacteria bacterium]|nr:septation protein SpoVG family protein [Deltaproteobacteria bacterium]